MNPQVLIDAIVRQTVVLIAQLSTALGIRAPLAHIADHVFLDLARELEAQGISRKVAADMFGLALRTYQTKVQRLTASLTERDRTLWEGVLAFVETEGSCSRKDILAHLDRDDPADIGAVLNDLVQSGFLERKGHASAQRFQVPASEQAPLSRLRTSEPATALVWIAMYRGAGTREELSECLGLTPTQVDTAIDALCADGRVIEEADGSLRTSGVLIPVGAEQGWEAAVFDHYQAVVTAVARKVGSRLTRSSNDDVLGGATLTFELHRDHPLRDDVRGLLRRVRAEVNDLWLQVREENQRHPIDEADKELVSFYFGQSVSEEEES